MIKSSDELAERLLDSYKEVGGINHIDGINLPSKHTIEIISRKLLHLLFPGFYADEHLASSSISAAIGLQLSEVNRALAIEVAKSLEYQPPKDRLIEDYDQTARALTCAFLENLPSVRQTLSSDVEAAYDGDPAASSLEEIILAYPGLEAIAIQRLAHELHKLGIALIPRMMTEWVHGRTGIDIHPGASIASHFFIDHATGVVIGETCQIGKSVKIYHGVTLGAKSTRDVLELRGKKRHPTIEDNVTIYPGATILGGETVIGAGSTIGGNVFLTHSVKPRSLVYYQEGSVKIISKEQQSSKPDPGCSL